MLKNMDKSLGLIYSQSILLALIDKGLSRGAASGLVLPRAMDAWAQQLPFRDLLIQDPAITYRLTPGEIDACFDPSYHLEHEVMIFDL